MEPEEWVERFAQALGVAAPDAGEVEAILELAGVAAHASARLAAPVACWVAARAGVPLGRALNVARDVGPAEG